MLRSVAVDIGNTFTKVGFFEGNALVETASTRFNNDARILKRIERFAARNAIVSNVGSSNNSLVQTLDEKMTLLKLNARTKLPIEIKYESKTLGQDRVALAVAGFMEFKNQNVIVISAGTCITYNFVSHQGVFGGGAISPGLRMRLKAMHDYTARLPEVKTIDTPQLVGRSTKASLLSGALNGAAFEMDGYIDACKSQYKNLRVVLTGGDLPHFEPRLKNKIFARPHAALYGLHAILQHNIGAI